LNKIASELALGLVDQRVMFVENPARNIDGWRTQRDAKQKGQLGIGRSDGNELIAPYRVEIPGRFDGAIE